jgi:hypothetical protein
MLESVAFGILCSMKQKSTFSFFPQHILCESEREGKVTRDGEQKLYQLKGPRGSCQRYKKYFLYSFIAFCEYTIRNLTKGELKCTSFSRFISLSSPLLDSSDRDEVVFSLLLSSLSSIVSRYEQWTEVKWQS